MLFGTLSLASCGDKTPETVKSKVDHVYKATEIDIGDSINLRELLVSEDNFIVYATEVISREPYESQSIILEIDPESGATEKTVIPTPDDSSYVNNLALTSDGNVLFLMQKYDSTTGTQTYSIKKLENDSFEVLCDDVSSLFESTGEDSLSGGGYFYIDYFATDKDGNIYITCDYAILVLNKDFNKLFELEVNGYIRRMASTSEGTVYVSYYDNGKSQIRYIDTEKKAFGDNISLPDTNNIQNAEFYAGKGYDIYYNDDSSVYGFNSEDTQPVELLNFVNSDINPSNVQNFVVHDADTMLCSCYDFYSDEAGYELLLLNRIPEEEIPEKYVIKLAYCPTGSGTLEGLAVSFNRASDEYRIELINYLKYSTEDDWSGSDYLENQILSKTAPDIIETSNFEGTDNWIAQGAFADINKLIEKDETFDRSKYFESVLNSFTDEKGRMYQFVTNFSIETIIANANVVGFDSWDTEKCIELISNLSDDQFLSQYCSRQTTLYLPIAASMDTFIDYENATCSFDSELFKKLLEAVKNISDETSYYGSLSEDEMEEYNNNRYKPYLDGTILLDESYIYGFDSYVKTTVAFGPDGNVVFLGYPSNEHNGAIISPTQSFVISENSILKEGAWEFIKFVSASNTSTSRRYSGFSSYIESFDKACDESIGNWYYYYSSGSMGFGGNDYTYEEILEKVKLNLSRNNNPNAQNGTIIQLNEEHKNGLYELINGAQALPNMQSKVFEIINEEAELYYSDAKSLDETVKIIQDRVSTYIAENY